MANEQNTLPIDRPETQTGAAHPSTSLDAAKRMLGRSGSWRMAVFDTIASTGDRGATDDEIATALDANPSTTRPRRYELAADGLVGPMPAGARGVGDVATSFGAGLVVGRPTRSGSIAIVWRTSEAGRKIRALITTPRQGRPNPVHAPRTTPSVWRVLGGKGRVRHLVRREYGPGEEIEALCGIQGVARPEDGRYPACGACGRHWLRIGSEGGVLPPSGVDGDDPPYAPVRYDG